MSGLLWVVLIGVLLAAASVVIDSLRLGISPMPASPRAVSTLLRTLPNELRGDLHELGSGWGTLALALARARPDCTVIAHERSWVPFLVSRLLAAVVRRPNLRLIRGNLFEVPLHDAACVVCYLFPGAMTRLRPKLEAELRPGAYVVSLTFAVPGWTPIRTEHVADLWRSPIYVYRR
jgi:hypothetical protein